MSNDVSSEGEGGSVVEEMDGMSEKCFRGALNQCPKLPLQVRFDFEEFELESSKASSCDVDGMTLINSPDGSGGTFCGFKGRDSTRHFLLVSLRTVHAI